MAARSWWAWCTGCRGMGFLLTATVSGGNISLVFRISHWWQVEEELEEPVQEAVQVVWVCDDVAALRGVCGDGETEIPSQELLGMWEGQELVAD